MIIRNGICSTLRARGRSLLFTLLILLLTLSLTLGLGMWAYCAQTLAAIEETYTSIALAEYIGVGYPDAAAADEYARQAAASLEAAGLTATEGVLLWENTDRAMVLLDGYERAEGVIPYEDYGVVVAYSLAKYQSYDGAAAGYNGVASTVYTKDGKSSFVGSFEFTGTDLEPEYGKRYLLHGKFVESNNGVPRFAVTDFYEGCETLPYLELSGSDDPALSDSLFLTYADYYRKANNYAQVEASADIASLEVFQQETLYLEQGRFPQAGESGVCVVSGATATKLGVEVGDTVSLTLLTSDPEDMYALSETQDRRTWEIVGVTNFRNEYEGWLWVSDAEGGFEGPQFGYTLGRAVLDNASARETADTLQTLAPSGVQVTLYDQGYAAAKQPLEAMHTTAMAISLASALGALVVLVLFAYLFVGRQRETVSILLSLGTPKGKIRLWLLSGGAVLAAAATLTGAVIGGAALQWVITKALSLAQSLYAMDTRYSEAAVGLTREIDATAVVPLWPAVTAGAAVFLAALLMSLTFLRQAQSQSVPQKGKQTVRVPKSGTSTAGQGALRFAALSAKRGEWRSAVVPAAALVLSLLIGVLAVGAQGWDKQLDKLYEKSEIQGQVVSLSGRSYTNLLVSTETTQSLWRSGMLESLYVSAGWNYWLDGEMPVFAESSFGRENRASWIAAQPELVALNDLSAAPEFYFSGTPEINWLEGWDESFLSSREFEGFPYQLSGAGKASVYPVLVSTRFLEQHSLALGDSFKVCFEYSHGYGYFGTATETIGVTLQVVGSFCSGGAGGELYVPLAFWMDPFRVTGENDEGESDSAPEEILASSLYRGTAFDTCRFTLSSAYDLEAFRNFLSEENYSRVDNITRNRTAVLLRDQSFTETVGSLGRYISFRKLLFPVLLAIVALLGFIISWLMINGRRMEFAIMRGLGASRSRVFWSFYLEQAVLALAGCLLSGVILMLIGAGWAGWLAAAGFGLCYLGGCALAVWTVGRTNLMSLLSEKE